MTLLRYAPWLKAQPGRLVLVICVGALLMSACSDKRASALSRAITITSLEYAWDTPHQGALEINDDVTVKGDLENTYAPHDVPCNVAGFSLVGAGRTYTALSARCESEQIAPNTKTGFQARFPVEDTAGIYTLRYKTDVGDFATQIVAIGVPTRINGGPVNGINSKAAHFFGFQPDGFTAWIARQSAVRCFPYLLVGVNLQHGFLGQSYRNPNFYGISENDFGKLPNGDDFRYDTYGFQGTEAPPIARFEVAYDPRRQAALGYFFWGEDYVNTVVLKNIAPPSLMNDSIQVQSFDLSNVDNYHGMGLLGASRAQIEALFGHAKYTSPCESLTATTFHHRSAVGQGNSFATFVFLKDGVVAFAYDGI